MKIKNYIMRNSKAVFSVAVVLLVAFTVVCALNLSHGKAMEDSDAVSESSDSGSDAEPTVAPEDVPMAVNEDSELSALVTTYTNAIAEGDMDTLKSIHDTLPERWLLKWSELSKYIDHYTGIQIYTKQGPVENSLLAYVYYKMCFVNHEEEVPGYEVLYVCRDEQGKLYIKQEANYTQEDYDYLKAIAGQVDVVDFNNRVTVEYNTLVTEDTPLLEYLQEVSRQVDIDLGVALADLNQEDGQDEQSGEDGQDTEGPEATPEPTPEATPQYASATTTVNVRSSDSEQADKLGRVTEGTRLQVQEIRVNGWTKVIYEGKDGYIKSEYLQYSESASEQEAIGTVTATTNINIRAAAGETAEKLGMLAGGESLDLLAVEGDWCKVDFNGQIAYVKAEYVTRQ